MFNETTTMRYSLPLAVTAFILYCHTASWSQEVLPPWLEGRELKPTYAGGAGLIIEHRCVPCHRPGEIAPMSFLTYDELRKWARNAHTPMDTLVKTGEMPPWPADKSIGRFRNWQLITQREIDVLVAFLEEDLPQGEGEFRREREWVEGWSIGRPDAVFELPEQTLGEEVEAEMREVSITTGFPENRWIVAAEARPGDPALVESIDAGPLGVYQPGNSFVRYPPGTGRLLKAGETVTIRILYRKEKGHSATDTARLGVIFAPVPSSIQTNILEEPMIAPDFVIPANEPRFEVRTSFEFPASGHIHALMPVMRARGKSIRYVAHFPDGRETILLSIPQWDQKWIYRYEFAEPIKFTKGTVIEVIAIFDNSDNNIKIITSDSPVQSSPTGEFLQARLYYSLN